MTLFVQATPETIRLSAKLSKPRADFLTLLNEPNAEKFNTNGSQKKVKEILTNLTKLIPDNIKLAQIISIHLKKLNLNFSVSKKLVEFTLAVINGHFDFQKQFEQLSILENQHLEETNDNEQLHPHAELVALSLLYGLTHYIQPLKQANNVSREQAQTICWSLQQIFLRLPLYSSLVYSPFICDIAINKEEIKIYFSHQANAGLTSDQADVAIILMPNEQGLYEFKAAEISKSADLNLWPDELQRLVWNLDSELIKEKFTRPRHLALFASWGGGGSSEKKEDLASPSLESQFSASTAPSQGIFSDVEVVLSPVKGPEYSELFATQTQDQGQLTQSSSEETLDQGQLTQPSSERRVHHTRAWAGSASQVLPQLAMPDRMAMGLGLDDYVSPTSAGSEVSSIHCASSPASVSSENDSVDSAQGFLAWDVFVGSNSSNTPTVLNRPFSFFRQQQTGPATAAVKRAEYGLNNKKYGY